ncbi:hypothetical protein X777_05712, partial [Ooceraea biroi]
LLTSAVSYFTVLHTMN